MKENINTESYWDDRFGTGNWENKGGRSQTSQFASAQIRHFDLPSNFEGTLVDFGCGLGDAIPIYRKHFPKMRFVGVDISGSAIKKCNERYGSIATFIHGTHEDVPCAEIIVASNVFEHLSNDRTVANCLLGKCSRLYIVVPYKEAPLCSEHVRSYDEDYFAGLMVSHRVIFPSRGWSEYGASRFRLQMRNAMHRLAGRPVRTRRMQIMYVVDSGKFSRPLPQPVPGLCPGLVTPPA